MSSRSKKSRRQEKENSDRSSENEFPEKSNRSRDSPKRKHRHTCDDSEPKTIESRRDFDISGGRNKTAFEGEKRGREDERRKRIDSDDEDRHHRRAKRRSESGDEDTRRSRKRKSRRDGDKESSRNEGQKLRESEKDKEEEYYSSKKETRERKDKRDKGDSRSRRDLHRRQENRRSESFERRSRERSPGMKSEREGDIVMPRYWGNEEKKTPRYKESSADREDIRIGERFYGETEEVRKRKTTSDGKNEVPPSQKRTVDLLTSKTGGAYIPPAKLRLMQAEITDKSGAAYQRIAWEALKKSIHGYINKINTSNIGIITRELLRENIVRGRGLLARSIMQAQAASPTFTSVYAALVAVINSKFPNIGQLIVTRLAIQFKRSFKRNDKALCISSAAFIAHLVNQKVAHEILALEILTLLVDTPTDDSIEVAIAFLKECGMRLAEVSKKGIESIFEMLRNILHEGQLDKRVQYMIEVMFQVRKDGFKDHEAVKEELDLVEEENQFSHLVTLDEATNGQDILNVFKLDPEYEQNEEKYKGLIKTILDSDEESGSDNSGDEGDQDSDDDSEDNEEESKTDLICDRTETNLTALRRTIYLTIQSSLDFEECAHKLMKMQLKPGQEIELCHMFLDCCAEMRTYEKFYGLLAGRFCTINKMYVTPFENIFKDSYDTIHRLDTNKLRNVAKFFAHLLFTDAISWEVLACIKLNEEDTTSSSRIFLKILFQELCEYMSLSKLNARLKDPTLAEAFSGIFPRDDPKNTRFAINFFTYIGLGGVTDDLREHLKSKPKPAPQVMMSSSSSDSSS